MKLGNHIKPQNRIDKLLNIEMYNDVELKIPSNVNINIWVKIKISVYLMISTTNQLFNDFR